MLLELACYNVTYFLYISPNQIVTDPPDQTSVSKVGVNVEIACQFGFGNISSDSN